jgi:hypothetical protein
METTTKIAITGNNTYVMPFMPHILKGTTTHMPVDVTTSP